MTDQVRAGLRPASAELLGEEARRSGDDPLDAAMAIPRSPTGEAALPPDARGQWQRAMQLAGVHKARLNRRAGRSRGSEMWQSICEHLYSRLLHRGAVDNIEAYLNACVTNELTRMRRAAEIVMAHEDLDHLREGLDSKDKSAVTLNQDLIDLVQGIRNLDVLSERELRVFVLRTAFQFEPKLVAELLIPPSTRRSVNSTLNTAIRKLNRAYKSGELRGLGYAPPQRNRER